MECVFDAYYERKREEVMRATWGHLAPEPRRVYAGHVLFALGAYGDFIVLDAAFDGLDDSPWFFDDLNAWVERQIDRRSSKVAWGIWRFEGIYARRKNGTSRFSGTMRPMRISYRFAARRSAKAARKRKAP